MNLNQRGTHCKAKPRAIHGLSKVTIFAVLISISTVLAPRARAQESEIGGSLVEGLSGGVTTALTGYALTALGLNSQSAYQTDIENQLFEINQELDTISSQLNDIQSAIETQTCVVALSSSAVTNALTSIASVSTRYSELLSAGQSATGRVTQADILNLVNQIANGPGGGLPSISSALDAINIALQSTDNDGIIGSCESAVTLPATASFGADLTFYADPINLLQYFGDYQTMATLLLVEYYNYQAFLRSPYFSTTKVTNGLSANQAAMVCANPTGATATQCGFARDVTEELYVYLQNQYSSNGVPYSTKDSSGNLQTGLYIAGNNTNYLFAASLEEFTNYEDSPQNNCPSPLTSASPCGLAFRNDPTTTPFWTDLFSTTYQFETGWTPATAVMWSAVTSAFNSGSTSQTLAQSLTSLGFQNASNKIILTPTTYTATPSLTSFGGEALDVFGTAGALADCFLDTNQARSFSHQPWCYNGSNDGVDYGEAADLLETKGSVNYGSYDTPCLAYASNSGLEAATNQVCFYNFDGNASCSSLYVSTWDSDNGKDDDGCPAPSGDWQGTGEPSWLIKSDGTVSEGGYFWPAIDVSSPTCGTNLSYGFLQAALKRTSTNFRGVPTMCGDDFDAYFSQVAPRNPFQQAVFTSSAVSGTPDTTASLGPMTIQMQDTSTGTTQPLTFTTATTVELTSSSDTGVFSLTQNGPAIDSITIPAGTSTATFWYGDSTGGTPQLTADPANMIPGVQNETISSGTTPSPAPLTGTTQNTGTNKANGSIVIKGSFTVPSDIQLQNATLTFDKLLSEDAGSGELVRQANADSVDLPVVLVTQSGSNSNRATYIAEGNPTGPRVKVKIKVVKNTDPRANFQINLNHAVIMTPSACTSTQSVATLHTRMIANDGMHPSAAIDANLMWNCRRHGKLALARGQHLQ
jgi:hypothetical protein